MIGKMVLRIWDVEHGACPTHCFKLKDYPAKSPD